ncbi:hypothetical protein SVIO_111950 [Streptomyces violaceusniger]|uniref:HTH gntR-type domain-containing protein n=1 Tax=Streptomyces violaceusniger TaxID=68280 RepID=A0A4D4LGX6_STRVO|nr:hypothetical protein SVIO_111950 [Streptomyces violaceusniger]
MGVSRATVVKAMDVLRNDGLVEARQGAGFTVVETPSLGLRASVGLAQPAWRGERPINALAFRTVRSRRSM